MPVTAGSKTLPDTIVRKTRPVCKAGQNWIDIFLMLFQSNDLNYDT
jgi:hypothetical protein